MLTSPIVFQLHRLDKFLKEFYSSFNPFQKNRMSDALTTAVKGRDISARRDPNSTNRPGMSVRRTLIVNIPPQIQFKPAFQQNQNYGATSIYEFARNIMYSWFPQNNFTRQPVTGTLAINNQNVGNLDFIVIEGQTITNTNTNSLFTTTNDTASAWIFVKGNLTIGNDVLVQPQPIARKLFTVLYVSGDLTFGNANSCISMSQRGANHSGTGTSGGFTQEVDIKVGPNTIIAANGSAGGTGGNTTEQSAQVGRDGNGSQNDLKTGGGGGGWWDYYTPP